MQFLKILMYKLKPTLIMPDYHLMYYLCLVVVVVLLVVVVVVETRAQGARSSYCNSKVHSSAKVMVCKFVRSVLQSWRVGVHLCLCAQKKRCSI